MNPHDARRILTLDILRGAALMGIFIVHGTGLFCGWTMFSPEQRAALPFPMANGLTHEAVTFLFTDKSRIMFAFMFGVSFFLQLKSAERRGHSFHRSFLRRLAVLLVFGLVHAHLLFGGDILRYYVLGGLLLLLTYRWSSRGLLIIGGVLVLLVPCAADVATELLGATASMPDWQRVAEAYRSPSLTGFIRMEHSLAMWRYEWPLLMSFAAPVAGTFLFGVWMARHQYLQQAEQHRSRLKTLAWWGLGVGALGQALQLAAGLFQEAGGLHVPPVLFMACIPLVYLGHQALTLFYICGMALLCVHPTWRRWLALLAPAGRMTLTNYILQSVLGALVFYGFGLGLFGRVGPSVALLITLGLCALQLLYSAWWLRHFQMGPLEWLWRWMVQGSRPNFRVDSQPEHRPPGVTRRRGLVRRLTRGTATP
ncbi:MAG TPA: DUF418 domain-containing protein [Archangium sp.]|jgi:uncharacterized protein|uniref:DUF418 domain-containing protein n=1 Tax=Archangium sp. TaxID=1872627 RepID=UPI002EDAD4A9